MTTALSSITPIYAPGLQLQDLSRRDPDSRPLLAGLARGSLAKFHGGAHHGRQALSPALSWFATVRRYLRCVAPR
jgi:hypothetical protein